MSLLQVQGKIKHRLYSESAWPRELLKKIRLKKYSLSGQKPTVMH